jgi:tRNA(Ile)-lysidine synthase
VTDPLAESLQRALARAGIAGGGRVIVALSGGLDSVVLLHLLRFGVPGALAAAAHLDHRMRPGSAGDAAWVSGLCRAWGVRVIAGRARVPPRSEADARNLRHAFLRSARRRAGADWIALAHHADDQAETVLFRIARGTGLSGLAGIPLRRGRLVRPLLPHTRAELAAYAARHGLGWREDPSNLDPRYARNRIRHHVLPALEAAQPGATRALVRLAAAAARDEAAWNALLDGLERAVATALPDGSLALAREPLLAYHPGVRARLLRRVLRRYGSRPDRSGTRAALEFISATRSGGGIDLAGGLRIEREFDRFLLRPRAPAPVEDRSLEIAGRGHGAGEAIIGGRRLAARWGPSPGGGSGGGVVFDADAIRFPLRLRGWQPGDRIRLGGGRTRLKKLFGARRLPRSERGRLPVLADAAGEVLWVAGVARAAAAAPTGAGALFHVTIEHAEPG